MGAWDKGPWTLQPLEACWALEGFWASKGGLASWGGWNGASEREMPEGVRLEGSRSPVD